MVPPVAPPSNESESSSTDNVSERIQRSGTSAFKARRLDTTAAGADARSSSGSAARSSISTTSTDLIRIEGELRRCATNEALWHHLANEPIALLPFGQALVLEAKSSSTSLRFTLSATSRELKIRWKTVAVSGLTNVNRDSPMTRWYEHIVDTIWRLHGVESGVYVFDLPAYADPQDPCTDEAALRHLMWVPLVDADQLVKAGWLLARNTQWEESHQTLALRLAGAYAHGLSAIEGRGKPPTVLRRHQTKLYIALIALTVVSTFIHVPLTTLAPVEVSPQSPLVMAAPMPGVVERILILPGAQVSKGTPLIQLVDTQLRSDFEVASQKLEVARAKMLRLQQASVEDISAKREMAVAKSEEGVAIAERNYAKAMLEKTILHATQAGVALYGDPRDWEGRPVAAGEAIMRVADPQNVEYQIKVPVSDAVNLQAGARVKVFLDAAPLDSLEARVVRAAYKAETDAAGVSSFTVTAHITDPAVAPERLGLRGTARIYGESVSLWYYLLRRPITAMRQWTGI